MQSTGRGQGNQRYNLLLDQEDAPSQSKAKSSHRHRDAGRLSKRQRPDTTGNTLVLAGLIEESHAKFHDVCLLDVSYKLSVN